MPKVQYSFYQTVYCLMYVTEHTNDTFKSSIMCMYRQREDDWINNDCNFMQFTKNIEHFVE